MNALELAAGRIVALVLGGRETPRDVPAAADMMVDFDVLLSNGRTIALEVTSAADENVLSLLAAGFGREWTAPRLANDWQIGVAHGRSVRIVQVMRQMPRLLEVYEHDGLTEVDTWSDPRWSQPPPGFSSDAAAAAQTQFNLGVVVARSFGRRQRSSARLYMTAHGGFAADPEKANRLIEAAAEANHKKLLAAVADERHLFVWLNPSHADAELAVAKLQPPSLSPAVPPGIDTVWLATQRAGAAFDQARLQTLWRVEPPHRWERLDPSAYEG